MGRGLCSLRGGGKRRGGVRAVNGGLVGKFLRRGEGERVC
jgi:hypothetical protein